MQIGDNGDSRFWMSNNTFVIAESNQEDNDLS
jgi:hypothetical protein